MGKNQTSFKKGEIHNPNGRPKKEWSWAGLIEESMNEQDETGEPYKKIMIKKLRTLGVKGDLNAMEKIFNRTEGMPKQSVEHEGEMTINEVLHIYKPEKNKE